MKSKISLLMMAILAISVLAAFPTSVRMQQAGTTLSASVTVTGKWTKTYGWTINKSVTPETWDLFTGDSGTSQYTITVTKDSGTEEAWVEGTVTVKNGGEVATKNLAIVVQLYNGDPPPKNYLAEATVDVSANPVLDPGETGTYNYRVNIPITGGTYPQPKAGGTYKVTANVTITNHSGHLGEPFGPSPSDTTIFPSAATKVNDEIHVDDTNGGSWTFSSNGSVSYEKTFTSAGTYENTATIRETGQSDSATVTVNCHELEVTKTAETSFTRTYIWTIDKTGNQTSLELKVGETSDVNYEVKVDATYTDSDWAVSGTITVYNPAPIPAVINSITDIVSPDIAATVDFGVTFPYTLGAGETLEGTYTASLPNALERKNTATVTLQNYNYKWDGTKTEAGTTDFSGTADVDFSSATVKEVDESVEVSDAYAGDLGTVKYENAPTTFTYTRTVGPFSEPGIYIIENTASFVTCDTYVTGSDKWTVIVTVAQPEQVPEQVYKIYGYKFYDVDADGEYDDNESGLEGWTIELYDDGTLVDQTTTDEYGYYEFTVEPGTYTVKEVIQAGWINTTRIEVTVTIENGDVKVNFGNIGCITTNARTIGYWKNWLPKFSDSYVLSLAEGIKKTWNTFDSIRTDTASNARKDMIGILDKANARDMSVMLKAQLLGMMLNIQAGYVNPDIYVYLGSISGASDLFGGNFKKAGDIVSIIDSNWSSWNRSQQEIAKNVLDAMNNNKIFVG